MSISKSIGAGFLVALAGCAGAGTQSADAPPDPGLQVQAAALGHVFENNDSSLGFSAHAYCVGLGTGLLQTDPSPRLLRLLQREHPKVARLSDCRRARDRTGTWRVVNDLSRLPSLAFLVEEPEFLEDGTARVYLEYVESPRFSTGYECTLSRSAEGWQVETCRAGFPR